MKIAKLYMHYAAYRVLDTIAGMLQDLARWFHKLSIKVL